MTTAAEHAPNAPLAAVAGAPPDTEAGRRRIRPLAQLGLGAAGGCALGVVARVWMRFIAEDPEFTWNGTIFIVLGFTIFGTAQAIVALARARARRRWTVSTARVLGAIGMMPLFVAAGGIMMPAVVFGGFATARSGWHRAVRLLFGLVALAPVVFVGSTLVGSFGWSIHAAAGELALIAIYAVVIRSARVTFAANGAGLRLPRWSFVVLIVVLAVVLVLLTAGFIFR